MNKTKSKLSKFSLNSTLDYFAAREHELKTEIDLNFFRFNPSELYLKKGSEIQQIILQSLSENLFLFCQSYANNNLSIDNSNLDNVVPINYIEVGYWFYGAYNADTLNVQLDPLQNIIKKQN